MTTLQHTTTPTFDTSPTLRPGLAAPSFGSYSAGTRVPDRLHGASGHLWGLSAALIWSGWWTVTRVGVNDGLPAADLAALRFGIAGALLLPLAWRERRAILRAPYSALCALAVGAGAPYALIAGTGVRLVSAGVGGAVTVGLLPLFTLLLSALILNERVSPRLLAGVAVIFVGAVCVAGGAWDGSGNGAGIAFFVLGAVIWAIYTVALRRSGLRPMTAAAVVCVASLIFYTPVWLATFGTARLLAAAPAELLLQGFYQSLLSAIGALYCFGRSVSLLGAARASVFAAVVPAFSVIIAAVVLGEIPGPLEIIGATLLSAGAFMATQRRPDGR